MEPPAVLAMGEQLWLNTLDCWGSFVGPLWTWGLPISPALLAKNVPCVSPAPCCSPGPWLLLKFPLSPDPRVSLCPCFQPFGSLCQLPRLPEAVKQTQSDTIPGTKAARAPRSLLSPFPPPPRCSPGNLVTGDLWAAKGRRSLTRDLLLQGLRGVL